MFGHILGFAIGRILNYIAMIFFIILVIQLLLIFILKRLWIHSLHQMPHGLLLGACHAFVKKRPNACIVNAEHLLNPAKLCNLIEVQEAAGGVAHGPHRRQVFEREVGQTEEGDAKVEN